MKNVEFRDKLTWLRGLIANLEPKPQPSYCAWNFVPTPPRLTGASLEQVVYLLVRFLSGSSNKQELIKWLKSSVLVISYIIRLELKLIISEGPIYFQRLGFLLSSVVIFWGFQVVLFRVLSHQSNHEILRNDFQSPEVTMLSLTPCPKSQGYLFQRSPVYECVDWQHSTVCLS